MSLTVLCVPSMIGEQYSTVEQARNRAAVHNILAPAPTSSPQVASAV